MTSPNKKEPGVRGVGPPFNRGATPARQLKPAVTQLESRMTAQSAKRPIAPPVYKPPPRQEVAQAKTVAPAKAGISVQSIKRPVAPAVYRPQPTPKVLQSKRPAREQRPLDQIPPVVAAPGYPFVSANTVQLRQAGQ